MHWSMQGLKIGLVVVKKLVVDDFWLVVKGSCIGIWLTLYFKESYFLTNLNVCFFALSLVLEPLLV